MQRFWWVNHKQTFLHERRDGYLWSPKLISSGRKNRFYDNMRVARAGDKVISFADGRIRAIGRVVQEALTAPKPEAFGTVGANWSMQGWLLPVAWQSVVTEIRPTHHLDLFRPLLPVSHSPINGATGHGNQNAYLAEISADLFRLTERLTGGPDGLETPACDGDEAVAMSEEIASQSLFENTALSDTERLNIVAARWGQGLFRKDLINQVGRCAITGVSDPRLLKASHIKPWRLCETAMERLSWQNGLLLTPTFDHLFDRGMLTFEANGAVLVSSTLHQVDLDRLKIDAVSAAYPLARHEDFLAFHRREIFVR